MGEERDLYAKAIQGDTKSRGELIISNLGYLHKALSSFKYRATTAGVSLSDLADQIIEEVIEKRFDTFDPTQRTRLGTYLFNPVFLSPKIKQRLHRDAKKGMRNFPLGKRPSYSELPVEGSREKDSESNSSNQMYAYFAIARSQETKPTSADFARDLIDYESVQSAVSKLPKKERYVINEYYLHEKNLREIGEMMGVSRTLVGNIHNRALKKLKRKLHVAKA
jgi:RNA polymerase sigma factor (sigma-70 family)